MKIEKIFPKIHCFFFEIPLTLLEKDYNQTCNHICGQLLLHPHYLAAPDGILWFEDTHSIFFLVCLPSDVFIRRVVYEAAPSMFYVDNIQIAVFPLLQFHAMYPNRALFFSHKPLDVSYVHIYSEEQPKQAETPATMEESEKQVLYHRWRAAWLKETASERQRFETEIKQCFAEKRALESEVGMLRDKLLLQEKTAAAAQHQLKNACDMKWRVQVDELQVVNASLRCTIKMHQRQPDQVSTLKRQCSEMMEQMKEQQTRLKKLNSKQKLLDQVQQAFRKKNVKVQVQDMLGILTVLPSQKLTSIAGLCKVLSKYTSGPDMVSKVKEVVRIYELFVPVVKQVSTKQLQRYMEAMLTLINLVGRKDDIQVLLNDITFACDAFGGENIREGIKKLQKKVSVLQGVYETQKHVLKEYQDTITTFETTLDTRNAVYDRLTEHFDTASNLEENLETLLSRETNAGEMIAIYNIVREHFPLDNVQSALTFHLTEAHHIFQCSRIELHAYRTLLAPILDMYENNTWKNEIVQLQKDEWVEETYRCCGEYVAINKLLLPKVQFKTLQTPFQEDYTITKQTAAFAQAWIVFLQRAATTWKKLPSPVAPTLTLPSNTVSKVCWVYDMETNVCIGGFELSVDARVSHLQASVALQKKIAPSQVYLFTAQKKPLHMDTLIPQTHIHAMLPRVPICCTVGDFIVVKVSVTEWQTLFVFHCDSNIICAYNIRESYGAQERITLGSHTTCGSNDDMVVLSWKYVHEFYKNEDDLLVMNMGDHVDAVVARIKGGTLTGIKPLIHGLVHDDLYRRAFELTLPGTDRL